MAPARSTRAKSAKKEKEVSATVSVTSKEATAIVFAAAALTYMSESNLFPEQWTVGAKTNKKAIMMMATKLKDVVEGAEPKSLAEGESPAEVIRKLNLDPATPDRLNIDSATPSRKRKVPSDLDDEEEYQRTYKSANIFGNENPFVSAAKTAVATRSEKSDPAAVPTVLENKEYFEGVATFMGDFGDVVNLFFDSRCPAMANLREGRPIGSDTTLTFGQERIYVVLVHDRYSTGCLFPSALLNGLVKATNELHNMDKENLTNKVPISFFLHAILRMNWDFGVVKLRWNDKTINKDETIKFWKEKYSANLAPEWKQTMCRRVAGLMDYVKNHGIIKCHALNDQEVSLITDGVADETVDAFWGAGTSQGHGRSGASSID